MPKVLNKRSLPTGKIPENSVYVGRPTEWGNPFAMRSEKDREEVVKKYEKYLSENIYLLGRIHELRGKDLVCWCAPKACHADILLAMANRVK